MSKTVEEFARECERERLWLYRYIKQLEGSLDTMDMRFERLQEENSKLKMWQVEASDLLWNDRFCWDDYSKAYVCITCRCSFDAGCSPKCELARLLHESGCDVDMWKRK